MILLQNLHLLLLKPHQPPVLLHLTMISNYTNPAWLYPHFFLVNCASVTVMFFLAPNNFLRAQPFHHQPSVPLLANRASQQRAPHGGRPTCHQTWSQHVGICGDGDRVGVPRPRNSWHPCLWLVEPSDFGSIFCWAMVHVSYTCCCEGLWAGNSHKWWSLHRWSDFNVSLSTSVHVSTGDSRNTSVGGPEGTLNHLEKESSGIWFDGLKAAFLASFHQQNVWTTFLTVTSPASWSSREGHMTKLEQNLI